MLKEEKSKKTLGRFFLESFFRYLILTALIICVCGSVLSVLNSKNQIHQEMNTILQQKQSSLLREVQYVEESIRDTIYNAELQDVILQMERGGGTNATELRIKLNQVISNLTLFFSQAENITLFDNAGNLIGHKYAADVDNIQDYLWFQTVETSSRSAFWLTDSQWEIPDNTCQIVSKIYARQTNGGVRVGDFLGYLVVDYSLEQAEQLLMTDHEDFSIGLFDGTGKLLAKGTSLWGDQLQWQALDIPLGREMILRQDGQNMLAIRGQFSLGETRWSCVCTVPLVSILSGAQFILFSSGLITLFSLVCAYFVSRRSAQKLTVVFENLISRFEGIAQGDWNETMPVQTDIVEVEQLTNHFNSMAQRLDRMVHELLKAELQEQELQVSMKEAQLMSLQSQINPHFLYNTLDTINWKALEKGETEISDMVITLGRLFRSNVGNSDAVATVGQELERVRLYMYLQQMRFGEKLIYEIDVPEQMLSQKIPTFLLQPLLENAIQHGIAPHYNQGKISIVFRQLGEMTQVCVINDGKEMEESKLNEVRTLWDQIQQGKPEETASGGVGLRNIMKRLHLLYSGQAVFSISSDKSSTEIRVTFPNETEDNR